MKLLSEREGSTTSSGSVSGFDGSSSSLSSSRLIKFFEWPSSVASACERLRQRVVDETVAVDNLRDTGGSGRVIEGAGFGDGSDSLLRERTARRPDVKKGEYDDMFVVSREWRLCSLIYITSISDS